MKNKEPTQGIWVYRVVLSENPPAQRYEYRSGGYGGETIPQDMLERDIERDNVHLIGCYHPHESRIEDFLTMVQNMGDLTHEQAKGILKQYKQDSKRSPVLRDRTHDVVDEEFGLNDSNRPHPCL